MRVATRARQILYCTTPEPQLYVIPWTVSQLTTERKYKVVVQECRICTQTNLELSEMVEIQAYHCGNNQNKVLSFIYTTPCSFEIAFSLIISFDPLTQVGRQRQVLSELQLIHRVPLGQTDKDAPSSGFRGRWWWQSLARLDVSLHFLSADPVVWCTTCPTIHSSPGYYLHFWWKKN